LANILLIKLAIKSLFKFPPHPTSASALLQVSRSRIIRVEMNEKNVNKFDLSKSVGLNSRSFTKFDCHVAVSLPDNVQECL